MKDNFKILEKYLFWLFLLLFLDIVFALILWIADLDAFYALTIVIFFGTLLFFGILCKVIISNEKKRQQAFLDFLDNPDEYHENILKKMICHADLEMICILGEQLREQKQEYHQLLAHISDYEEYVEAWAHETKIPISFLTLLLDNRREELPKSVGYKLDYIRNRMQEYVNQMLFYARLKSAHKDYFFEFIKLFDCIEEILDDYDPLLQEKGFEIIIGESIVDSIVYADRRGLCFIINQAISNTIKYHSNCLEKVPKLCMEFKKEKKTYQFSIKDNGIGVPESDLPYIFEKGFTGISGENRKKATGMGLYLAKEIAYDLNLSLEAQSEWKKGFELKIIFPIVEIESEN